MSAAFYRNFASITPDENGCMIWPLSVRGRYGYGQAWAFGRIRQAHRGSAIAFLGLDPDDDVTCVLHRCDNPSCIAPDHLFLGTKGDNARDRDAKGRTAKGNDLPHAKLNPGSVHSIRQRLADGENVASVARSFGVTRAAIRRVREGKAWSHV